MKHDASTQVHAVKRLARLAGGLLLSLGLLLTPHSSFADNPQDDAAFTCSSALNVMDCIKQTGTGAPATTQPLDAKSLPINSGLLGFTGPLTVGLRYDNYLAWILDVGYAQSFLDNSAAAALKLSAGLNERRANLSLGYAITPNQQIKLTYEYLAQNLPFDYASGKVNEWVNQNAFGAAYRYIIGHDIFKNIEVYGTYTKARSKELSEVEMYTDNLLTQINYRRIAGGTEMTGGGSVTLTPLKGTILKVGAGYSSLSFDTKWEKNEATAALVYNAELTHLLTPTTLISTGIGNTASGRTHTAKVSQILPWSLEGSLMGQYVATTNDIPGNISVTAALSYPAPKTYENMITAGLSSIKDWVEKPLVYHSRVLAKAEERLVQVQITTKPIPPAVLAVAATLNPPIQTKDYFAFNSEVFEKISYQIASITQKDNKDNVFNPQVLGLQVAPIDNYNAVLNSATVAPVEGMTPGQYTLTLEASGYRKGQVVSRVQNPIDISVTGNPDVAAATWNNPVLPTASPNSNYDSGSLYNFVSGIKNEPFIFSFNPIADANWITLKDDHLIGKPDPQATQNAVIELTAKSQVSDKDATPNPIKLTITMSNTLKLPDWKNSPPLPATANQGISYANGAIILNPYPPYNGTYLTKTNNGTADIDDTLIFSKTTPAPGDACPWIEDIDPKSGKLSGTPPGNALNTSCKVYVDVYSDKANAVNDQKNPAHLVSNLITVNSGYQMPTWTDQALPEAIFGLDYGTYNNKSGATFDKPVILDPYETSTAIYVDRTKDLNGGVVEEDHLTFAVKPSAAYNGTNDPLDCSNWLGLKPASQLFGAPPVPPEGTTPPTYCNAYIEVTSEKANSTAFLSPTPKRITFSGPSYISPKWNGNNLPVATSTVNYNTNNVRLNTYALESGQQPYVDKAKIKQTGQDVDSDTWDTFAFATNNCTWLTINANGDLAGTPPATASGTCSFKAAFNSSKVGNVTLDQVEIPINSTKPLWKADVSTNDVAFSSTIADNFDLKQFIQNQDPDYLAALRFTTTDANPNLPSGGINNVNDQGIVKISMDVNDVVGQNSQYITNQGTFTATARLGSVDSNIGTFKIRVVGNLNPPDQKKDADGGILNLPLSTPNVPYNPTNITLDPYQNTTYLTKTTVNGNQTLEVPDDKIHFKKDYSGDTCSWASISDQGVITGTPPKGILCNLSFIASSEKSGKEGGPYSLTIPTTTVAPTWNSSKLQNLSLKFDTIACVADYPCIDLNDKLTNTAAASPNLDFNFNINGTVTKEVGNWLIKKDDASKKFNLFRRPINGSIDATDVDDSKTFTVVAENEQGSNAADLTIKVLPEDPDKIEIFWSGDKNLIASKSDENPAATQYLPNGGIQTRLKTKITGGPAATYPLNDQLVMGDTYGGNVTQVPTGPYLWMIPSGPGIYSIVVYGEVLDAPANYGTYPNMLRSDGQSNQLILNNFYAKSRGEASKVVKYDLNTQLGVTLTIAGPLQWNFTSPIDMKFDAIKPEGGIYLNNYMKFDPNKANLTNFRVSFKDPQPTDFGLVQQPENSNNWYLVRRVNNNTINAMDIDTTQTINLVASADNMVSSTNGELQVNVKPNPDNVNVTWAEAGGTRFIATTGKDDIYLNNYIKTHLKSDNTIQILDTVFTQNNANVVQSGNGIWIKSVDNNDGKGYRLVIPGEAIVAENFGVYPNTLNNTGSNQLSLPGFYTKSQGSTQAQNLDLRPFNVTISIAGKLTWKWSNPLPQTDLLFDAVNESKIPDGVDGKDYLILNTYISSDLSKTNFSGYSIKFADGGKDGTGTVSKDGLWKILYNDKKWYLMRAVRDNNTIDANDATTSQTLPAIIQSNPDDGMENSDPRTQTINLKPDPNLIFEWNQPAGITKPLGAGQSQFPTHPSYLEDYLATKTPIQKIVVTGNTITMRAGGGCGQSIDLSGVASTTESCAAYTNVAGTNSSYYIVFTNSLKLTASTNKIDLNLKGLSSRASGSKQSTDNTLIRLPDGKNVICFSGKDPSTNIVWNCP